MEWKFCPHCGHGLMGGWKFCAECGAQLQQALPLASPVIVPTIIWQPQYPNMYPTAQPLLPQMPTVIIGDPIPNWVVATN